LFVEAGFATIREWCRFMRRKDLDNSLIREYVTEALLQLLEKKDYDEISVREIAERAGVHRATFYRHFSSKEDVLRSCFVEILKGAEGDRKLLHKDFAAFIRPVFQALYDRREEILLLNRAHLTGLLMDVLKDYFGFEDVPAKDLDSVGQMIEQYRSAYRIGGIYSCLLFWFSHDMKETPEDMARIAAAM
jgi:AcrR family transcriptional regulator